MLKKYKKYLPITSDTKSIKECFEYKRPKDKDRYLGIELECCVPSVFINDSLDYPESILAQIFIDEKLDKFITIKGDGSIDPPRGYIDLELCILVKESEATKVVNKVIKVLKGIDAKVNDTCGMHVHLDMRKRNPKQSFKALVDDLPKLMKQVKKNRVDNRYCYTNKINDLEKLKSYNRYNPGQEPIDREELDRYLAINPWSLEAHNTIEVRLHEGTLDSKKINKWVKTLIKTADKEVA